jgi:FKBP-type peptidyl-prolyl cis-trans isomerase
MKLKWMAVIGVLFLTVPVSAQETQMLKTQKEKVSYSLGADVAKNFKKLGVDVDMDMLMKGMKDVLSGEKLLMSEEELRATLTALQGELKQKQMESAKAAGEANKKAGEAFLEENKKKEGVVALPSGLQYKVLKAGDGKKPADTDTVECHYRGTLINGTEFDSSYNRGQPANFKVTAVIGGWTEALKLMPVGSKWQLFIPPQLAYEELGAGRDIGPNTTLIFEVELLGIK